MEELLKRIYSKKKITASLKIISHASVFLGVIAYSFILIWSYLSSPLLAVRILVSAGVPYVIVTVSRAVICAPRPYELYDFYEVKPKDKEGRSFPSRHVFSAFLIATLAYTVSVWLCIALFALGVCLAISRVLLGIHFIRDVVAGALIGLLSGIIGILIIM